MKDNLKEKAETVFYFLTKMAARDSFIEFLDECDCTDEEWQQIKQEISFVVTKKIV